jgi:hypothetical protein
MIPATGDPATGGLFKIADAHAKAGGIIALMPKAGK